MQFLYLRYTNIKVVQHVKTHFTQLQFRFYLIVYNLLRNLALLFYLGIHHLPLIPFGDMIPAI